MHIDTADISLIGDLQIPPKAIGLVIFAHGSGSSRRSPRNLAVAHTLQTAGLATLLFDLLTPEEAATDEITGALRFDIPLLASRLIAAVDWASAAEEVRHLPIGCFGASTGAAAALMAAAERPAAVKAVVSRGGRPDLAGEALLRVLAPTLLIVGTFDTEVIALNQRAALAMSGTVQMEIVQGATHLFEEPGALDQVAMLATRWFQHHLRVAGNAGRR
jgi:putative phosphoribosyl transferase